MNYKWYVVHVYSGSEKRVKESLEEQMKSKNMEEFIEDEKSAFDEIRQAQQERIDELQKQLDSMQELVDGVEARRTEVTQTIEKRLLTI